MFPSGQAKQPVQIKVAEGAPMRANMAPVVVPALKRALAHARATGMRVIFTAHVHRRDGHRLDIILRGTGTRTVIVTGVTTENCCHATARDALFHDYEVVFGVDCARDERRRDDVAHENREGRVDSRWLSAGCATGRGFPVLIR